MSRVRCTQMVWRTDVLFCFIYIYIYIYFMAEKPQKYVIFLGTTVQVLQPKMFLLYILIIKFYY